MSRANPGDWIKGPFWPESVQVVGLEPHDGHDVVTVHAPDPGLSQTYVLAPADWEQVRRG